MFRTIVGAILFIEIGIPLIMFILLKLFEDGSIGCIIFAIAIILLICILA